MSGMQTTIDVIANDMKYLRRSHDEFRREARLELKEIREQTQKTNGRVNKAVDDILALQKRNAQEDSEKKERTNNYIAPLIVGVLLIVAQIVISLILIK